MVKFKKVSKARALVLPKDLSAETGIFAGTAVDMETRENGIFIKKHIPVCLFCGSAENVRCFKKHEICAECAEEIGKELIKYA